MFAARRACGALTARPISGRSVHATPSVWKKRRLSAASEDTSNIQDLFGDDPPPSPLPPTTQSATRQTKFTSLLNQVTHPHTPPSGSNSAKSRGFQTRNSVWTRLFDLAQTEEEVKQVVEQLPRWKGRELGVEVGESLIRRCATLVCPTHALDVFGNHSKYALPLSLTGARHLMHTLYARAPLTEVIVAAQLFEAHGLVKGGVGADEVGGAMVLCAVVRALAAAEGEGKEKEKQVIKLARALVPALKEKVTKGTTKEEAPRAWLNESFRRIEHLCKSSERVRSVLGGVDLEWMRAWKRGETAVAGL